MPTGPKGEKRPADAIGNAVKVMRIATEEEPEDFGSVLEKNEAAAEMGRKGASPRASAMKSRSRLGAKPNAVQTKPRVPSDVE
jgi:hypothetical protein